MALRVPLLVVLTVSPLAAEAQAPPEPVAPIALDAHTAQRYRLAVGDTFRLGPAPDRLHALARVVAIYEPRPDPARVLRGEASVRLHLPDLAALLGAPDRVDRFAVTVRDGADPEQVAADLNRGALGYRADPSAHLANVSSRTFLVVSRFHRAIGLISILASGIFLLCIMLLKVESRRKDTALMRFVGIRRRTIFGALFLEATAVALAGSVVGVGMAWGASVAMNAYYQRLFHTALQFSLLTPRLILVGVALSLGLGLAAGALAAARLARTPPLALWSRPG